MACRVASFAARVSGASSTAASRERAATARTSCSLAA